MVGINNLTELLKSMKPELIKGNFVFCTLSNLEYNKLKINPIMLFKEKEGITIIVQKELADKFNLEYTGIWSMITLRVHSDLNAVGFLAKITEKLAKNGISVNPVSAYYHDHLFPLFLFLSNN